MVIFWTFLGRACKIMEETKEIVVTKLNLSVCVNVIIVSFRVGSCMIIVKSYAFTLTKVLFIPIKVKV